MASTSLLCAKIGEQQLFDHSVSCGKQRRRDGQTKCLGRLKIAMSALPPESRHVQCNSGCPLWAKSGHRFACVRRAPRARVRLEIIDASTDHNIVQPLTIRFLGFDFLGGRIQPLVILRKTDCWSANSTRSLIYNLPSGSLALIRFLPMEFLLWPVARILPSRSRTVM